MKGMQFKIIDQNTVLISARADNTAKVIFYSLGLIALIWAPFGINLLAKVSRILASFFMFGIPTWRCDTTFDTRNRNINSKLSWLLFTFRDIDFPLEKAALISTHGSAYRQYGGQPALFIKTDTGKTYQLGNFYSTKEKDQFLEKLIAHVPIKHFQK